MGQREDNIKLLINEILIGNKNEIINNKNKINNNFLIRNSSLIIKSKNSSNLRFSDILLFKKELLNNFNNIRFNKKKHHLHLKNVNTLNEMINEGISILSKKETNKK